MTVSEIAKALGVSKSTVSRALAGKGRIGKETREKIREFAREAAENEKEDTLGRARKGYCLGAVIPADAYTANIPFFQECLLGISEAATMLGCDVLIVTGSIGNISGVKALIEQKKVDGIILMRCVEDDRMLKYLTGIHFPTGLIGSCHYDEVIQVDINNEEAAENLTTMLIDKGYRSFALVYGDSRFLVNTERSRGFLKAADRFGLPRQRQAIYPDFSGMEMLESIAGDILMKKLECVICGDDVICTRLMSKLQADGYRIPMDISIASLHNSSNLECFSPAVTSVSSSAKQAGILICKQLVNYLAGSACPKKTLMEYEILFRKSTKRS